MAGLSGQTLRDRTLIIDTIAGEVIQVYKRSLEDAIVAETRFMQGEMDKTLRNIAYKNVYSYPAKNTGRRYEHGGLADSDYYELDARILSDGEMQIMFTQREDIPTESFDDIWGGWDTRKIVEYGGNRQPYPRPYFDEVALTLAQNLPENIQRRTKQSLRMRGIL